MIRAICLIAAATAGFVAAKPSPTSPDPHTPRPIAALDTVFIEEMTWMEIRDALQDGTDTVIVSTGGVEQNGPYLATGKHNYILQATTEAIARKLGKTLVAPNIAFVPEGNIDPPTSHMRYPGTISLTEETYERLLTEICASLRTHGFRNIVLIGDSGGNQKGLQAVEKALNAKWANGQTRVSYIPEYYDFGSVAKYLEEQGIKQVPEGLHDDFAMTAMMMSVDPDTVRSKQRIAAKKFRINGVDLAPMQKTIEWGKRIIDFRANITVKAIRKRLK